MSTTTLPDDALALRQLRHQSRNALQRILADLSRLAGIQKSRNGQRLLREAERRILASAALSDALFGLTRAPGPLEERLRALAAATVRLMADPDQIVDWTVEAPVPVPAALEEAVFGAAHELLANAVKHGLRGRMLGRLALRLRAQPGILRLEVEDDGWGLAAPDGDGEGLALVRRLLLPHHGRLLLRRREAGTLALVELPLP
ncbi:ATP-binding protein [Roseococcus sp. DSY-14]|uniref:ATP-binding protein n=1 Tax=Roseococcus sp. DSY-14 TaxID=3369650 RepID=UPI00387B0631